MTRQDKEFAFEVLVAVAITVAVMVIIAYRVL